MSWWGCCFARSNAEERTPLSAETKSPRQVKVLESGERIQLKKVNVAEFDEKFDEIGELYNKQVDLRSTLTRCLPDLCRLAGGTGTTSLTTCVRALQEQYGSYNPDIRMEGYNFSLVVQGTEDIPEGLKEAQNLVKQLSRATKLLLGNQSKLGGMVFSLVQRRAEMENKIKEANPAYLDQIRLVENLGENMKNLDRAKLLSEAYREEANNVLKEVANIVGLTV